MPPGRPRRARRQLRTRPAPRPPARALGFVRRFLVRWPVVVAPGHSIAIGVATDFTRPASNAGQPSALQTFYLSEQGDFSSCAGGLLDTLIALRVILTGACTERGTAEGIAVAGAQARSPASNGDLFDMWASVPLAGFGLSTANNDLSTWCDPGAARVQSMVSTFLADRARPGSPAARALDAALVVLERQGEHVQAPFDAISAKSDGSAQPVLAVDHAAPADGAAAVRPGGAPPWSARERRARRLLVAAGSYSAFVSGCLCCSQGPPWPSPGRMRW